MTEKKRVKVGRKTKYLPVKDGYTPSSYLKEVNAKRKPRSIAQDNIHRASTTFSSPTKVEDAARWVVHPNKYDIEGIDAPKKPKAKTTVKKTVEKPKAKPTTKVTAPKTKPLLKKTVAKPKAKPAQDDPDIKLMARYFKALGKDVTTPEEFVMCVSLEHKWMSPSDAKVALNRLIDKGLMVQKGEFVRSAIYLDDVDISEPQNLTALKEATKKNNFLKDHIVFASVPAIDPKKIKKPVKDTDMKRFANMILSFYGGSITKKDFVTTLSDLYKWMSPAEATKLLNDLIEDGYLESDGEVCTPTFDITPVNIDGRPRRSTVPFGYRPWGPQLKENTDIRTWYMYEFPADDLGPEIRYDKTFYDLFEAMDRYVDVDDFLGVDDSIVRERVFAGLAEVMGVPYSEVYEQWMMSASMRDPEIDAEMDYERWWDDQLSSNNKKSFGPAMRKLQQSYLRSSGDKRPIAKDPEVCGFLAELYGHFYDVNGGNAPSLNEVGYDGFLDYILVNGVREDVKEMLEEDIESGYPEPAQSFIKRLDAFTAKYASANVKPKRLKR